MKISGFSMCRNAEKLYYPIRESILSALPLVDEYVIAVGNCDADDRTLEIIKAIDSPKIRILRTSWNLEAFPFGMVHAQQTDLAKSYCTGDWLLYLQADEVLHEEDYDIIRASAQRHLYNPQVEGLLFDYTHFWGDYAHQIKSHGWYPYEIRMIKNDPDIHSWESAQSFRRIEGFDGVSYRSKSGSRKLKVASAGARVFHYGWVRPPQLMTRKMRALDKIHSHTESIHRGPFEFGDLSKFDLFDASHPSIMTERMGRLDWHDALMEKQVSRTKSLKHEKWKNVLLTKIERSFLKGRQLMAYKNYVLVE